MIQKHSIEKANNLVGGNLNGSTPSFNHAIANIVKGVPVLHHKKYQTGAYYLPCVESRGEQSLCGTPCGTPLFCFVLLPFIPLILTAFMNKSTYKKK
jgi:hypothetical protein